jgi:hypothetical protein
MPLSNQKSDYYQYDESLGGLLVGTVQVYSFVDNKTFSSNTEYLYWLVVLKYEDFLAGSQIKRRFFFIAHKHELQTVNQIN